MPGVTGSTGRKAKLLLRRGGITVLCERNAGASDNPTLKQKSTNTFQSQSHTSSCQGGRLEISAALSRSCGLGVFPRSLIVGSMAESYHHITECPTHSVFSPDGGRAPGAGTLAQASPCLFLDTKQFEPELVLAPGQGSKGQGAFKAMGCHCEILRCLLQLVKLTSSPRACDEQRQDGRQCQQ